MGGTSKMGGRDKSESGSGKQKPTNTQNIKKRLSSDKNLPQTSTHTSYNKERTEDVPNNFSNVGSVAKRTNGHSSNVSKDENEGTTEPCKLANIPDSCDLKIWWLLFFFVCVASFGTRLYKIEEPHHVCWDETHFGKMGSWYINRTFFFDVHPPLGKMLIGLSGYMTGYDGSFPFSKPGEKYDDAKYVGMRVICACMGACVAPLAFCITWHLSHSYQGALLSASFIILDTGVLTLSQYILLDPILLFAIMLATWSLLKFHTYKHRSFSVAWWFWLLTTGFFLACAISVKFVGLFVVLLAGVTVAWDLWCLLGDLQINAMQFTKYFGALALSLIVFPVIVYIAYFAVHFSILNRSGNGDGFFSSSFQSQLIGNALYNASMPAGVAYGSIVTIKNHRAAGAYLHSHPILYPEGVGARQQQVTTYTHKDDNNKWRIKPFDRASYGESHVQMVTNGDLVRLEHIMTHRNLHSHKEMAPLTKQHYQVTCYGENGTGDSNDAFILDIPGHQKGEPLQTVRSVFRLIHYSTGCAVHSHNKQLPKWAGEQLEVTCNPQREKSLWNIEEVLDKRLPNTSFEVYAPSFVGKLIESHAVMTQGHKNLKPKEGEVTSQPWQWPLNFKGQPFSGGEYRIYLLGNPVVWWTNLAVILLFSVYAVIHLVKRQRYPHQPKSDTISHVLGSCGWLLMGWALHYVPFWTMTRVLYFHHYFPAFLYSCMLSGIFIDHMLKVTVCCLCSNKETCSVIRASSMCVLISILLYSFVRFSALSYGMVGSDDDHPEGLYTHLRWLRSWDI